LRACDKAHYKGDTDRFDIGSSVKISTLEGIAEVKAAPRQNDERQTMTPTMVVLWLACKLKELQQGCS